ncbi:hypothetical protein M3I54_38795 [Paraburkholderia sp. CNPSo 3274]|uniref:hypothetical protein n=1 Tax=Paraburkholderia sp. CNPSo 3274 TaxID=2940932 RepID=UPI0020B8802B|nr:hypothetical protein [Paraburkholderia sp. CNPSo 3274]MCP3712787.1 hypothetical protein [Paraburkholderia sp. CNPSo 3274]
MCHAKISGPISPGAIAHEVWYRVKRRLIPTDEQQAVIEAALRLGDLKVKAVAGAGKTSTLQLVAEHFGQRRGMYLAFNREIAASAARRFPAHVDSRTMHSLAWASMSASLRSRVSLQGEPPHELAARYGLGPLEVRTVTGKAVEIAPFEIGRMIADGRDRFCRSADIRPAAHHILSSMKRSTKRSPRNCAPTCCLTSDACGKRARQRAPRAPFRLTCS